MANIRDRMMPRNVHRLIAQQESERGRTAIFALLTLDIAFRNAFLKSCDSSFLSLSFRPMASIVRALALPKREGIDESAGRGIACDPWRPPIRIALLVTLGRHELTRSPSHG